MERGLRDRVAGPFGVSRCLRCFDRFGEPAIEFHVPDEGRQAFDFVVAGFAADDTGPPPAAPSASIRVPVNDDVDVQALRAAWDQIRRPGDLEALLRRFGTDRAQAFRLAGRARAHPVDVAELPRLVATAGADRRPMLVRGYTATSSLASAGLIESHALRGTTLALAGGCLAVVIDLQQLGSAWRLGPGGPIDVFDRDDREVLTLAPVGGPILARSP